MRVFIPRFLGTLAFFAVLTVGGTVGYMAIEGWAFHDALYMTVITLTAVGYSEVLPLSEAGRNFTMVLLTGGITGMGLWFALITSLIVELDLKNVLWRRRIMKDIETLADHVIVCGAGRTGRQVVEELLTLGQAYVVIERDSDQVEALLEAAPDSLVVEGDATSDHSLELAGIGRARGLVACLSADTDNLFVTLSARDMNPELLIVARAFEEVTMSKLYRAGADHVVSPNVSSAIRMASVMLRPSVISFLDVATRSADFSLRLEQATISERSPVAHKTLGEAKIPQKTGLIVIAVLKGEGHEEDHFVFNPVGSTGLEPGDTLIVLGQPHQVTELRAYLEA